MYNSLEKKETSISFLRITATLAVVWLHTCSTLVENRNIFNLSWQQIQFYNSAYHAMNWAVPVFFMITGALLLNPMKEITIEKSVKKYIMRIFYPLCFWGIIYAFLMILSNEKRIGFYMLPKSIEYVIEGKSFSHLWYLYVLIGIYLILPLIKSFINNCCKRDIDYLLFVLFIMDFVFPFVTEVRRCGQNLGPTKS